MAKEQSLFSVDEYKKNIKKTAKEESLQLQVCTFLKKNYPDVIWFCDLASGAKLPPWIAAKNKKMRSSRGLPDSFIAYPAKKTVKYTSRHSNGPELFTEGTIEVQKYGLFIELKKDGTRRKDGTIPPLWQKEEVNGFIVKYDHHAEQEAILKRLKNECYEAKFACGYDEAVEIIKNYLAK